MKNLYLTIFYTKGMTEILTIFYNKETYVYLTYIDIII